MNARSKRVWTVLGAAALVVLGVLIGLWLRRPANPPASTNPPLAHRYRVEELSPLGATLEGLDEGRVSLAPPASWYIESRRNEYLARFRLDRSQAIPLPRITVEVREAEFQQLVDATEPNLGELLQKIRESLGPRTVLAMKEPPQAFIVGNVPCIRYLVRRDFSVSRGAGRPLQTYPGEREVVMTLAGGRVYSIMLDAHEGKAGDYRGDLFAVVASLRFQQSADSPE